VPLAEKDTKLPAEKQQELAKLYGDRCLALLHTAVQRGFRDRAQLEKDAVFAPLRTRPDYQKLMEQIEAASNPNE
jgi:hypothetical protein